MYYFLTILEIIPMDLSFLYSLKQGLADLGSLGDLQSKLRVKEIKSGHGPLCVFEKLGYGWRSLSILFLMFFVHSSWTIERCVVKLGEFCI